MLETWWRGDEEKKVAEEKSTLESILGACVVAIWSKGGRPISAGIIFFYDTEWAGAVPIQSVAIARTLVQIDHPISTHGNKLSAFEGETVFAVTRGVEGNSEIGRCFTGHTLNISSGDRSRQTAHETDTYAVHAEIASEAFTTRPIGQKGKVVAAGKTYSSRRACLNTIGNVITSTIYPLSPTKAFLMEGVENSVESAAQAKSGIGAGLTVQHIVSTGLILARIGIIKFIRKTFSQAEPIWSVYNLSPPSSKLIKPWSVE